MLNRSWSTDFVPAPQRFGFWRDAVHEAIVGADPERPSGHDTGRRQFRAELSAVRSADLGFVQFAASGHAIVRSPKHVRRDDGDPFLISLQTRGESHYGSADGGVIARRGEIAVVNSAHPFRVDFPGPVSRTMAILPRAMIRGRAPWLERARVIKLAPRAPYDTMLRHCLTDVAAAHGSLDDQGVNALIEHIGNLIALARPTTEARRRDGIREAQLALVLAYIRSHLRDPGLSPARAARHLNLSVRWLHRLLEPTGCSFGDIVRDARLDACRRSFADPAQACHAVAELAFAHGFGDLSHFHRAFKSRFGLTPGQARAAAVKATGT